MSDLDLKPCPFCGGQAAVFYVDYHHYRAICRRCGAQTQSYEVKENVLQLESQVPKWIPVTERLPEDYHDVLVSVGEMVDVGFHHHRYGWECYSYKKRNDVTHWMPLPSAPEEVSE